MSFGLQRVVPGTWSRDGHVLPPSWERAVLRLTITGPSSEERLTRSGEDHRRAFLGNRPAAVALLVVVILEIYQKSLQRYCFFMSYAREGAIFIT